MTDFSWVSVACYLFGAFMGAVFTCLILSIRRNDELDALEKRVSDLEEIYDHAA